jgi:hypothetical protein
LWHTRHHLTGKDIQCLSPPALVFTFANTNQRRQTGILDSAGLGQHVSVTLAMVSAAFRMTDDGETAAKFSQHGSRDVARMGTGHGGMAILAAQNNRRPFQHGGQWREQGCRWAQQHLRTAAVRSRGYLPGQSEAIRQQSVHFPVAGH